MSGSRGRKSSSHLPEYSSRQSYTNPRWPGHQQQYCDQNSSLQRGWPNNNGWNVPQGYHGWPASNPNVQVWPQPQYQHSGHQRAGGDTFQFNPYPQRFTNAYNPPYAHFTERSLAYLNQTPLNELTRGGHRDSSSHRGSTSSVNIQHNTAKNERLNAQNDRSKEVPLATTSRSGIPSNHEKSNTLKSPGSINIPEKPASVPAQTTSFMPPNDDLRNKVKASLKMMAATKDQVPTKKTSPATTEPIVPSSPQRQRESRVPSVEGTSPSTRHGIRVAAGSQRRISQSSTSSNPAANDGSLLEGIGFIQSTSADVSDQAARVGNASASSGGDGQAQESDPVTTISKDQLNRYIRTMDNHQRRQLVEQPRSNISQYMLNHLVQENQTARARQLTSLRFRVSSSELEMTSKTDTHVVLCDELVEQIKVLLAQDNEEPVKTLQKSKQMPEPEEEEIQVLEPPPKTPPLCIDLDLDDQPAATAASLSSLPPTSSQQTREQPSSVQLSINGARTENSSKSTPTVPALEVPLQPPANTRNSSLPSVEVGSIGRRSNSLSTPAPTVPTTSEVPPPLIPVSSSLELPMTAEEKAAHRKSEKKKRKQEKLKLFVEERRAKQKQKQGENQKAKTKKSEDKARKEAGKLATMQGTLTGHSAKQKEVDLKSKKQKKKKNQTPTKSPPLSIPATVSNFLQTPVPIPVQTPVPILAQMSEGTAGKGTVKVPAPEEIHIDSLPNAGHPRSALKFLLQDLQIEEQQGKSRITVIDSTIEALLLERKSLTDRVLALKQRQFDLLSSSLTNAQFESDVPKVSSISQTSKDEPVAAEPAKAADGDVVVPPSPTGASTQLLTLMHQLEENGVQVALGELELEFPTDPVASTVSSSSVGTKRKRISVDEVSQLKRKTTPSSSPSRNALSIQDRSITVVPASVNPPTVQSLLANDTPVLAQTSSPRTIAVSSISGQSVGSSVPTKTHTTVSSETEPTSSSEPSVPVEAQTRTSVTKEPEALPSVTKPYEPNSMLAGIPEEAAVDNSVAKKPAENGTDVAASRLQNVSQKNSPLLPTHQLTRNTIPRISQVLPTPQVTPTAPEKLPQVLDPKKVPQSNTLVSKEAASADQPSVGTSGDLVFLPSHTTSVRCCFVNGPCIFTASEDGTVHVYDMATRTLSMRIRGHENPVTWLYAVSLNTPSDKLRTLNAAEYLNQLNLITGSEDTYVRQFSLETGRLLHEKECSDALTCVAGHKLLGKLFIGSKEGHIFTYGPKANVLRTTSFRATAEVICLKVARVRDQKAIIVAARRMDPVVYNLETEEAIFTLSSNIPSSSFYCMSTSANFVYCCDANKNVFTYNMLNSRSPLCQTETLPSAAVSCYHDGNRYLILGCIDGVIRVLDLLKKSTTRLFVMPGQHVKTLTCMKVSGDKIVLGSLAGEVAYRCIPDLEAISKIQESL